MDHITVFNIKNKKVIDIIIFPMSITDLNNIDYENTLRYYDDIKQLYGEMDDKHFFI